MNADMLKGFIYRELGDYAAYDLNRFIEDMTGYFDVKEIQEEDVREAVGDLIEEGYLIYDDKGNNRIEDKNGRQDPSGQNPLEKWYVKENGRKKYFSEIFNTYNWKRDNGYENIGEWVEEAARIAGR